MEIFWILVSTTVLGLIGYGLQILAVRSCVSQHSQCHRDCEPSAADSPPISILKPLKDLDDNLFDNLESFCDQDYPQYEVVFSLESQNDPAYKVARKIKDKYPEKRISIIIETCRDGLNPKVNNLIPAYRAAKFEYILISDSNVMVSENYLKQIVIRMKDPGVGLVSNLIKGVGGRTIGSVFENLHLNSFIMGSVCFLDKFLKSPCVIGKSMLMRKSDFEAIGGFMAVKDVLAEDYVIGQRMQESGRRVVLSSYMIENVNLYWGLKKFLNRHTRWGKMRWQIGRAKYLSELIGNPVFISFLSVVLCEPYRLTLSFALMVSILKALGDWYIGRRIGANLAAIHYLLAPLQGPRCWAHLAHPFLKQYSDMEREHVFDRKGFTFDAVP